VKGTGRRKEGAKKKKKIGRKGKESERSLGGAGKESFAPQ